MPASSAAETPAAAPTTTLPASVRSTTEPCTASVMWMSPLLTLICAGPVRRPTEMSPAAVVRLAVAASSILTGPCAPSKVTSPSRPTTRNSPLAAFALTWEPAGSWTVTSMDPEGPRIWFLVGVWMRSTPSP